jgi:hypothetical protein
MKRLLNFELLEFHVNETIQELRSLLDSIRQTKDSSWSRDKSANFTRRPLTEGAFAVSLEHAYHHLNFAWNGRFKTMEEADAQFDRNEKFPRPSKTLRCFERFWPKTLLARNTKKNRTDHY